MKDLRHLFDFANEGIWIVDEHSATVFVNKKMASILKYSVEEMEGKSILEFAYDDCQIQDEKRLRERLRQGWTEQSEIKLRRKDGTPAYLIVSTTATFGRDGRFLDSIAMFTDITERKQMEDELRKSQEKYRRLTEDIDDLIWETDKDGFFTYMSPRSIDIFGNTPEYALGKTSFDLMLPESAKKVAPIVMAAKMAKKPFTGIEAIYVHGDGHLVYMEISGRPVIDENGDFMGYRGISRDVTKRKMAEMALEAAKSEAELYVDLMGHDINNMNQITLGFLELAQAKMEFEGKLGLEDVGLLEKAMSSLKNSSMLIDNVRKLQREKMGLYKPEVLDIVRLVREVVPQYEHVPGRDVKINVATANHCYVNANELLKDVFINLVGNSIKHSRGSLEVNIGVYNVIRDGREYCKVIVEDNGPGIPDTLKATLFDRLNLANTRVRGKGFGLCLIKMLIDDYDGIFYVENRVQGDYAKGSRFVVMIPSAEKS